MFTSSFFAKRFFASVVPSAVLLFMMGCGGMNTPDCGVNGIIVGPATATVDHTAAAPANTQTFSATFQFKANNGCAISATSALVNSNWITSDPSVHLSASPTGQVTATCAATAATPVTITATSADANMFTAKAALTCN
jgi:hypothetical protein